MKRVSILLVLALLVVGLVANGIVYAQTEITFWHAMSGPLGETVEEIVSEFNSQNPDIRVEAVYQGSYGDLETKIMAGIQARRPPTVAQVYENFTDNLVINDAIVPLEDYLALSQAELNDYIEVFRDMNTWNGKLYTIPFNKSTWVLFYNTDVVPEPPATLDEFLAVAEQISNEYDGEMFGFGIRPTVELFDIFLHLYGGAMLDDELNITFTEEAGVQALDTMKSMLDNNSALMIDGYESDSFGAGLIAMYIGSSAGAPFVASAAEGNVNWSMAPIFTHEAAAAPFMGTNVALFAQTSEAQREAAAKFVEFLTNTENTTKWAIETGYLPVRYSALESDRWLDYVNSDPAVAEGPANPTQFENGFWQPRIAPWSAGRTVITTAVEEVLLAGSQPQASLDNAARSWERDLRSAR